MVDSPFLDVIGIPERLFMLPNFLVIGVQKAGSSWLVERIGDHPDVFMATREAHFFNDHFEEGLDWYEKKFSDWSGEKRVGEGSPGYISHPLAAERIKSALGADVKLIGSLRHPVDRAYSAYWMSLTNNRIPRDSDFRTLFAEDVKLGLHARGCYADHMDRMFSHFPRENVRIFIQEEDMRSRGPETLRACYEFLDIDPDFVSERAHERANQGQDLRSGGAALQRVAQLLGPPARSLPGALLRPMQKAYHAMMARLPMRERYKELDADLRQELLEGYLPQIHRLEDLLERDLSVWYGKSPSPARADS